MTKQFLMKHSSGCSWGDICISRSLPSKVPSVIHIRYVFLPSVQNQIMNLLLLMHNDYWAIRDLEKWAFLESFKRHLPSGPLLWPLVKLPEASCSWKEFKKTNAIWMGGPSVREWTNLSLWSLSAWHCSWIPVTVIFYQLAFHGCLYCLDSAFPLLMAVLCASKTTLT